MHNAIGIIFGNTGSNSLQGLVMDSPIAAIPFGGRYRVLDFALSSMVNSGIRTVGLVTPYHYRPMLDHLGAGKDWFLDRKTGGLFILPGAIHGLIGYEGRFRLKDLKLNIEFLQKDFAKNVVISCSDQVFNINFRKALEFHAEKGADVTLIYLEKPKEQVAQWVSLKVDDEQTVREVIKWPEDPRNTSLVSFADILIIRRKLLLEIIEGYKCIETSDLIDAIIENLAFLQVAGFRFDSYLGRIRSIKDYFDRNMDLLRTEIRDELFTNQNPIHTKVQDTPPTKFGTQGKVRNSLISCGCSIDGEVENSILSREVVVYPGAKIKNSIIMQKCRIGPHAILENAVLDKSVEVKEGNVLKGSEVSPLVVYKKVLE